MIILERANIGPKKIKKNYSAVNSFQLSARILKCTESLSYVDVNNSDDYHKWRISVVLPSANKQ